MTQKDKDLKELNEENENIGVLTSVPNMTEISKRISEIGAKKDRVQLRILHEEKK